MSFAAADGKSPNASPRPSACSSTAAAFLAATGARRACSVAARGYGARRSAPADLPDPTKDLYPVKRNDKVRARPADHRREDQHQLQQFLRVRLDQERRQAAQALKLRPWTVKIDGMVEKPQEIGIDDLIRKMPLEERLYRHRCVEAWSMADPVDAAFRWRSWSSWRSRCRRRNIVRMETFLDPAIAPGQKQTWYPWPYVEG